MRPVPHSFCDRDLFRRLAHHQAVLPAVYRYQQTRTLRHFLAGPLVHVLHAEWLAAHCLYSTFCLASIFRAAAYWPSCGVSGASVEELAAEAGKHGASDCALRFLIVSGMLQSPKECEFGSTGPFLLLFAPLPRAGVISAMPRSRRRHAPRALGGTGLASLGIRVRNSRTIPRRCSTPVDTAATPWCPAA